MLYCALVCFLATVWQISADTFDTRVVTPVVQPPFQIVEWENNVTVQCNFPHPLIDCRVRLPSYSNPDEIQVADFSRGSQSPQQSFKDASDGFTVTYVGRGLSAGDCGVTLLEPYIGLSNLVECLGRAADGSWSRGTAMVSFTGGDPFASTLLTPHRIVVAPGSDVAVLLKSPVGLRWCYLSTPVDSEVKLYHSGTTSNNRYRQHGRGLAQQECGYLLSNVQQRDAGLWSWRAYQSGGGKYTAQSTIVVVLSAPVGDPILELSDLQSLRAGSILLATCRAPPSAPPANMTWLLDGHVVRRDQSNDTLLEDLASARPWEPQPVVQTFTRNLLTEDMGKRLECRMDHAALSSPKSVVLVLPGSYTAPTPSVPAPCAPTTCVPAPTPAATSEAGCSALATTSVNASMNCN